MSWVIIGSVVIVLFLVFLSLFFWSSGATVIDEEVKEEVKAIPPEQLADELIEVEKEDIAATKAEEDAFYSQG